MATIAQPHTQVLTPPKTKSNSGLWSWLTTIDHKRIGLLYGLTAFAFFLIGGLEALLIRVQLIMPGNGLLTADQYNAMFTMHGTTMIFLAVMPLSAAFFNYLVPLQIGARDVAFPRLNAFSFWTFLFGGIMLNISWLFQQAPDQGWYGYAPLTDLSWNPTRSVDFWALGLQVLGVASMAASFNFIVTILNMRAPGMTMMKMPIFSWATLVTSVIIVMAFPAITVALILLTFDRYGGTQFFATAAGGDPMLWQHLFWVFGHPEVYILILPAFGIISEIIPVFSRKPLFGYAVMVYALAVIAFLGFGVWVHHMFTTGLGPTANAVFSASTMIIAIPTGVKIFNWIGTLWKGHLRFTTPMLFAVGLISQFMIGGLSGVMHAVVPVDSHHNDSYFVIAHFHYVLFGGSIFGIFAAIYYWFPKFAGRIMDEGLGKLNFWSTFVGFNLTFFPMHFLGLEGMPRRYAAYAEGSGWWFWNVVVSFGSFLLGASILLLVYNAARSLRSGKVAGPDPWDGATLEWSIPSPPPVYNFLEIPTVTHRDQLWADKYGPDGAHRLENVPVNPNSVLPAEEPHIHLPNPSFYPLVAAFGFFLSGIGMLFDNPVIEIGRFDLPSISAVGIGLLLWGIYGWSFEPAED